MTVPAAPFPVARFTHLRRLTDAGGLFEHACGTEPRPEHGYCVDDVARALVVVCRDADPGTEDLRELYLSFLLASQVDDGRFRNRRSVDLGWTELPSPEVPVEDCWGRALWGLGAVIGRAGPGAGPALAAFERGAAWRTPHPRAMAFAAFGAADVLRVRPGHGPARDLLRAVADLLGRPADAADSRSDQPWPWPRLTYANAALPDAMIAAGTALRDRTLMSDGLLLLRWLLEVQTRDGRLSVVPVGGRDAADVDAVPGFDQQPIEAAALADACARAFAATGDARWTAGLRLAVSWFLGVNDAGTALHDRDSDGCSDGLQIDGRNANQGAESTLALLSTLQHARTLSVQTGTRPHRPPMPRPVGHGRR